MKTELTVVVPCYNEEESLHPFFNVLIPELKKLKVTYEIICVNDGSKDQTLNVLTELRKSIKELNIIDFSRNFGKEAGILAGLRESKGEVVVLMDADLQDPPSLLEKMYTKLQNDTIDSVATYRVNRVGEPKIRSYFARKFYQLINKMSDVEIVDGARDYRMMTRTMVDAILSLSEYHRFSKGIFVWVGFNTEYLPYKNIERVAGETKWSFWSLFRYAIEGIVAFTTVPLRLSMMSGIVISLITFVYMIFIFIKALLYGDPVDGWPTMMVIILFLGGIQLLSIGIIGEYLSKTYMEVKKRPNYVIRKKYPNS